MLRDASNEIVYSRSRRDSEGRLLGISPLAPSEMASQHLQRSRIPQHAFSESDRLLARRQEFSETERAKSAVACYRDWRSLKTVSYTHLDIKTSGYTVDTLEAAIWSFLTTASYEEAVVRACLLYTSSLALVEQNSHECFYLRIVGVQGTCLFKQSFDISPDLFCRR